MLTCDLSDVQVEHVLRMASQLQQIYPVHIDRTKMGGGKSRCAKAVSRLFDLPLLIVRPGAVTVWEEEAALTAGVHIMFSLSYSKLRSKSGTRLPDHGLLERWEELVRAPRLDECVDDVPTHGAFKASAQLEQIVRSGVLCVFDECHAGKNSSDQTRAIGAIMQTLVRLSEQPLGVGERRSYALMLSGTPFERHTKCVNVLQSMGLIGNNVSRARDALEQSRLVKTVYAALRPDVSYYVPWIDTREQLDEEVFKCFTRTDVGSALSSAMPSPVLSSVSLDAKLGFYNLDTKEMADALSQMNEARQLMSMASGRGTQGDLMVAMSKLTRSVQMSHMAKVDLAVRLMREVLDSTPGTQVILFGTYLDSLNAVSSRLSEYGVGMLTGSVRKSSDRQDILRRFQSGQLRVLVANVVVGGAGLNLQDKLGGRQRTTFLLPGYNAELMYQSMYRTYRYGCKSDVKVRFLFSAQHREQHILDNWKGKDRVWAKQLTRQVQEGQLFLGNLLHEEEPIAEGERSLSID
jgi:hypothetical protein